MFANASVLLLNCREALEAVRKAQGTNILSRVNNCKNLHWACPAEFLCFGERYASLILAWYALTSAICLDIYVVSHIIPM